MRKKRAKSDPRCVDGLGEQLADSVLSGGDIRVYEWQEGSIFRDDPPRSRGPSDCCRQWED